MTDTTKNKCCAKHKPRCPYTFTAQALDNCLFGCDKPGIGSAQHNPGDNRCSDCALCCVPFTLIADILCCIPLIFGYINVDKP